MIMVLQNEVQAQTIPIADSQKYHLHMAELKKEKKNTFLEQLSRFLYQNEK